MTDLAAPMTGDGVRAEAWTEAHREPLKAACAEDLAIWDLYATNYGPEGFHTGFDKVIALPIGFMASTDRAARDLALEHELAHHRARDLAVNYAALPLFALHWFNPLGWLGWAALRRDQEAACDARVVEQCDRPERAAYATLIASLAAGPDLALAAPMACPVLGEKNIIQRLRSLTMIWVTDARALPEYRLWVRFSDATEGEADRRQ